MVELLAILLIVAVFIIGFFAGFTIKWVLRRTRYDGILKLDETEKGLMWTLELVHDPDRLTEFKEVIFKVDAPDYQKLLASHKDQRL